ncbi:MAG TPA: FtsQ-type POTRA domain-containing protein [Pyrinomonadaceae bacterium]|nr:FtsQ-type POTRA domain-containing protein [Pyrinomonadaceae bacterium]
MKEQVIASRGPRRAATQQKGFVQRPTRRDGSMVRTRNFSPRALFTYVPKALKFILAIVAIIALFIGYRMAASAALFQVQSIDVVGTSRVSAEEIQGLTRRALARTGVWRADLHSISNELSRLPGVRRAVVTRVLPDRIRVRITERAPLAVVRTSAGHFVWVDDEGVMLGEIKPDDRMPAFFIRGWNEEGGEDARRENAERVQKYLELEKQWTAAAVSRRVSEVTLSDLRDVRAQLAGDDSQTEVRLGADDLGNRLQIALEALDTYKQMPGASAVAYVDVQTGRVTIGRVSGTRSTDAATVNPSQQPAESSGAAAASDKQNTIASRRVGQSGTQTKDGATRKPAPASLGKALRLP